MSNSQKTLQCVAVYTRDYAVHPAGGGENVCVGCLSQAMIADVIRLLHPQHPHDPEAVFRLFMHHAGRAAGAFDDAFKPGAEPPQALRMIECTPVC